MALNFCVTCLAASETREKPLQADQLIRWQAVHLDQARAALLPTQVEAGRLRDRVRELEEIVERQNRLLAGRKRSA